MPTICFETLGCKVNQYDTDRMIADFRQRGFEVIRDGSAADVYVVNSCAVTSMAEAKSRRHVRRLANRAHQPTVILTGCSVDMAIRTGYPIDDATLVVSNAEKATIVERLLALRPDLAPESNVGCEVIPYEEIRRTRAVVKVQEGCDVNCTYCSVPFTRGSPRSRPIREVVDEVRQCLDRGQPEIVLAGILLGSYTDDCAPVPRDITDLVEAVSDVQGVRRVRLSSIEPMHITDTLLELMQCRPTVCPHLHIPLQSGDDEVLRAMGRPYTRRQYIDLCGKAQSLIPDLAITTDVLVGFPGESEAAHTRTLETIREVGFSRLHVFRYSKRAGTPAAEMSEQISDDVKVRRSSVTTALGRSLQEEYATRFLHRTMPVIVEGPEQEDGYRSGYTANYMRVRFPCTPIPPGSEVNVRLATVQGGVIEGQLDAAPSPLGVV